jgi:hypothetical protein
MTVFELITQSPDELASFIWGLLDQCELQTLEHIACCTGITVDRVALAPELRIEKIKHDLMEEV